MIYIFNVIILKNIHITCLTIDESIWTYGRQGWDKKPASAQNKSVI